MSPLGTRRAADELQRALEGGAAAGGVSSSTASLVALGERLRETGTQLETIAVPDQDFRAALRTRLVAVATVQPATAVPAARASSGLLGLRGQKAAGVAAGALASVVAVSGVAVASSQALPGDPFYGVKRTAEDVQLRLAGGQAAEGDRHLQFAETRLDEVRQLTVGRDAELSDATVAASPDADWDRVREALADMDADTRTGSTLLEQVWREDGDTSVLTTLSDFADEQFAELEALLPLMAPEARGDAEASLGLVAEVGQKSAALLSGVCTEACGPGTSPSQPGAGGECECGDNPSSPQPTDSASPEPTRDPATEPDDGSTPLPGTATRAPEPAQTPATTPPPTPLPPLPTAPLPPPLPTDLQSGLPTVAPSLPLSPTPLPLPSADLVPDDLVPGGPGPLLPG